MIDLFFPKPQASKMTNLNDSHQIAGDIEEIKTQLHYVINDIKMARREVGLLRDEVRQEMAQFRADTAVMISRQNSTVSDNKKKLPKSLRESFAFTTD